MSETRQLVVFSLSGEEYAFPISAVSEIIRQATPRAVASDTPGVRGVIGLRGKIIPIVDLIARIGLPAAETDVQGDKVIILDTDGRQLGVMVDEVDQVVTISSDQLEHVPTAGESVEAIAKIDDRLVMVLDPAAVAGTAPPAV